jgi:hypothetical protein
MKPEKVDAVLPLHPDNLGRATILFRTLARNFEPLGRLLVIVPDHALARMKPAIQNEIAAEVLVDSELVPEVKALNAMAKWFSPGKALLARRSFGGWYLQQIIKIAAAKMVSSPFYILLDSDVIVTRKVSAADLFIEGKAICTREKDPETHNDWYEATSKEFGFPDSGWRYGVTPFLFSKEAVGSLIAFLDQQRKHDWRDFPAGILARLNDSWRSYLMRKRMWTEVSLYFQFLESRGRLEHYHAPQANGLISSRSIWTEDHLGWLDDPAWHESLPHGGPFLVVQSRLPISDTVVWDKLKCYCGK